MVVACAMHWYVSLLYIAPVGAVVGFLKFLSVRDRRAEKREANEAAVTEPVEPSLQPTIAAR